MKKSGVLYLVAVLSLLAGIIAPMGSRSYAEDSRTFPQTGKSVGGKFLQYWDSHGALAQQGLPVSEQMQEQSDTDGKTYTMQYFERAVFEMHPENAAPYDVLLSLLGTSAYETKYKGSAPGQKAGTTNPRKFSQTGKTLGGAFRTYWEEHGGLAQQGYPISDEFQEKSATDGKTYTVQYFERAVFELHPEFKGTPNEVLLSLLGVFSYNAKHGAGGGGVVPPTPTPLSGGGVVSPTPTTTPPSGGVQPSPETLAKAGWTTMAATTNNIVLFYNAKDGSGATAKLGVDGSLTPVSRFPDAAAGNGSFSAGWTHIVAGPSNLLFFYMQSSGAAGVVSYGDDGIGHQLNTSNVGAGWSYIAVDRRTGVTLLYNADKEIIEVARINPDGSFTKVRDETAPNPKPTDFRWSQFVPLSNGLWFWYVQGNGNGIVVTINGNGTFNTLQSYTGYDRAWTQIVYAGNTQSGAMSKLFFYKKSTGDGTTQFVNNTSGSAAPKKPVSGFTTTWTNSTSTSRGSFLFYDSAGILVTSNVDDNGDIVLLKRYVAPK